MAYTTVFTYDGDDYVFETELDYGELYELAEIDYFNIAEEVGIDDFDMDLECSVYSVKDADD